MSLLKDVLDSFFLLSTAQAAQTRKHYERAVHWLGLAIGRPAKISDLTDDHLRALLSWLQRERQQTPITANTSHKCIVRLWRWCRDRGLITTGPTVPPLREPVQTPRAGSAAQLRQLVAAAVASPGTICGLPASTWWLALLALEWDTGCRASELLELRWEWLDWERAWLVVPAAARKGQRRDAAYGLMADTMRLLASIRQPSGRILRWDLDRSRYYQLWKELLLAAGLPTGRHFKTQWLRRSFASHLQAGGGDATAALGHSSRATTLNHYLDPTLTAARAGESMPFRLLDFREGSSGA